MKELTPNEVSPPTIRFNEDTDTVQQTPDGGETWIDTPQLDPRHGSGFRRPPLSGGDARCDAAAREMAAWKEIYDIFQESVNALQFLAIILNILLILAGGGFGVLLSLILLVFDALVFIGKENMEAAFSEEVWDGVMCIIYNNIGEDGQVSEAELSEIYIDIYAAYPGTVYNTLIEIGHLFGEVLLSNASVERSETGDCSDCCDPATPFCHVWDFTADDGDWAPATGFANAAQYIPTTGWASMWTNPNNRLYIQRGFTRSLVEFVSFDYVGTSPTGSEMFMQLYDGASLVYNSANTPYGSGANSRSYTVSVECDRVVFFMFGQYDTQNLVVSAELSGVGCPGFGDDNC
jgi:hypothetical protein